MSRDVLVVCGAFCSGLVVAGTLGSLLVWRWMKNKGNGEHQHDDTEWTIEMVDDWVGYHYMSPKRYVPFDCVSESALDFPVKIAQACNSFKSDSAISRALDIGCATGRMSFELALSFNEVIGLDISQLCIEKANQLKSTGKLSYNLMMDGQKKEECLAEVNPDVDRNRVTFMVGDANALPDSLGQFGLVLITNTLCHLPDPLKFLEDMKERIVPSGIFVIADFYGWDEMLKLPEDRWVACYEDENNRKVESFEGLQKVLSSHFDLVQEVNMQCLVRFCPRMLSLQIDHVTIWRRKEL